MAAASVSMFMPLICDYTKVNYTSVCVQVSYTVVCPVVCLRSDHQHWYMSVFRVATLLYVCVQVTVVCLCSNQLHCRMSVFMSAALYVSVQCSGQPHCRMFVLRSATLSYVCVQISYTVCLCSGQLHCRMFVFRSATCAWGRWRKDRKSNYESSLLPCSPSKVKVSWPINLHHLDLNVRRNEHRLVKCENKSQSPDSQSVLMAKRE